MADSNLIKYDFEDQLKIEGINFKGFGVLPKFVMLDTDLTIEAKAIYAYFCSFAGNGNTTFPGRSKILSDLSISKDCYYKHFGLLTSQEYIVVTQTRQHGSTFAKNIYTLVSNPKKFEVSPEDKNKKLAYSKIKFNGLKASGYGIIPKSIMLDVRLSLKAKGIYAYFCSYTGSGNNAFPKKEKILFHLGISEKTYYKFYKLLTELNYITTVQRHINGRLQVNDYCLNDLPDELNTTKKSVSIYLVQDSKIQDSKIQDTEIQDSKIQNTEIQDSKIQDTEIQDSKIQDTEIQDTNINSFIKNSIIINNSLNQQVLERISDDEIDIEILKELTKNKKLPLYFNLDNKKMTMAIHIMTEWKTLFPKGFKNELDQNIYNLFNEALIEMCCSKKIIKIKEISVTYEMVIEKINQLAKFEDWYIDITNFSELTINNFTNAILNKEIKNPLKYMKSCIWDAMITGNINMYADLKKIGC